MRGFSIFIPRAKNSTCGEGKITYKIKIRPNSIHIEALFLVDLAAILQLLFCLKTPTMSSHIYHNLVSFYVSASIFDYHTTKPKKDTHYKSPSEWRISENNYYSTHILSNQASFCCTLPPVMCRSYSWCSFIIDMWCGSFLIHARGRLQIIHCKFLKIRCARLCTLASVFVKKKR